MNERNVRRITALHRRDALRLLEDGRPHRLRLWKLSTGDILTYEDAVCIHHHRRGGWHRVRLPRSALTRCLRDVCLFEIDGLKIYL
ncbi:MAG: hypothetical protein IJY00_02590 [Bacteroidaceae bacterium]|nr:hypothetical protein [Bacteroidaceae bacterium]